MSQLVEKLKILEQEGKNLFDTEIGYIIPLYQRAFAWEDTHLIQLIEDICDVPDNVNYCIGSLIVSKQGEKYEVIDGQQRLTALYLLLNCLGLNVKQTLTFACRDKSNYTLEHISDIIAENRSKLEMERTEQGIQEGIKILQEEISKAEFNRDSFFEKLRRVTIYRIEVPKHTDLNRYFEIMNTRGEQLEQHDILKAYLMDGLPKEDRVAFANIWDACSDMTGYVQMHFRNKIREKIFGSEWNSLPSKDWDNYKMAMETGDDGGEGCTIGDIIKSSFVTSSSDGYVEDDIRVRFKSFIEFPYFLIHTLKVLINKKNIKNEDGKSEIIAELLDDKKLLESFENVIEHGCISSEKIRKDTFAREFVVCLLRTRYLFDKYIVKREYTNENADGEWSLKSLKVSNDKPYYVNSMFSTKREWNQEDKNPIRVKENIMIQSALRVSYTSPKVMHWITELLISLSEDNATERMGSFVHTAEEIAKKSVREGFLNKGDFSLGVATPHIVFNYLDFLLWKNNKQKYDDFVFEFRNSVEHWYPQNPSEGTFEQWVDDGAEIGNVDRFGNLCIVSRKINSKFSNMSPEAKKITFKDTVLKGSIKLRIMSDLTNSEDGKSSCLRWKNELCREHENEMIRILKDTCGVSSADDSEATFQ